MSNFKPKVSIVIPTYNRTSLLRRAIESVIDQTYRDFEIIVVQNGPDKSARDVVGSFEKHHQLRYIYEERPCAVRARNIGCRESKGEFIAFLDDDDRWLPDKLEKQVSFLEKDIEQKIGLVFCHGVGFGDDAQAIMFKKAIKSNYDLNDFVSEGCPIRSLSSVLIRKRCFKEVGQMNETYIIANDYDFYLRVLQKYKIHSMAETLYRYYCHSQNLSKNVRLMYSESARVLQVLCMKKIIPFELKNKGIRRFSRRAFGAGVESFEMQDFRTAYDLLLASIALCPFIGQEIEWGSKNRFVQVLRPYVYLVRSFKAMQSLKNNADNLTK